VNWAGPLPTPWANTYPILGFEHASTYGPQYLNYLVFFTDPQWICFGGVSSTYRICIRALPDISVFCRAIQ
jgi:hypothetical protein